MIIVEEYDTRSLYFMFLKCCHHLHSIIQFEVRCVKQAVEEDCNLHFFKQIVSTTKLEKNLSLKTC